MERERRGGRGEERWGVDITVHKMGRRPKEAERKERLAWILVSGEGSRGGGPSPGLGSWLMPWLSLSPPQDRQPLSFDNQAFVAPQEDNWAPAPRSSPGPTRAAAPEPPEPPEPAPPEPPSAAAARPASESPEVARDGGGPAAVRSILTKERRPEGGYKAVWFGEDIGAEADVVVLNTPASDAARAADSGGEVSSDEDADADGDDDAPGAGSTYV